MRNYVTTVCYVVLAFFYGKRYVEVVVVKKIIAMMLAAVLFATMLPVTGTVAHAAGSNLVEVNATNFPDENFRNYLLEWKANGSSYVDVSTVKDLSLNDAGVSNLKGIEFFTSLESLSCSRNNLTSLDLSKNVKLTELYCSGNTISSLDLRNNTALTNLHCTGNNLSSLDLSNNPALMEVECGSNNLTSLNLSNNANLEILWCGENDLTSLDVSNNPALELLYCSKNNISTLDVSKNKALTTLDCQNNKLSSLNVSNNTLLDRLYCDHNSLGKLDVSKNKALTMLGCSYTGISSLDVSKNTNLETVECSNNNLTKLNTGKLSKLYYIHCSNNKLATLDLSQNEAMKYLYCENNKLGKLYVGYEAYSSDSPYFHFVCDESVSIIYGAPSASVKLSATAYNYNGKVRKPSVTIKDKYGKTVPKNVYTVTYAKGRKNVGKYKVTVKYDGTKNLYFTIYPKATTLSKVTAAKKGFTVKWKKQAAQTTGYQIQYALNSKFTSGKKTVTVKKNTLTSKKIAKLKAKKKYYVRIRTYKKVGKLTYYSPWSKAKTVTTKK